MIPLLCFVMMFGRSLVLLIIIIKCTDLMFLKMDISGCNKLGMYRICKSSRHSWCILNRCAKFIHYWWITTIKNVLCNDIRIYYSISLSLSLPLSVSLCLFRSGELQHDHYTAPAAHMELGLLHLDMGKLHEAEKLLDSAKLVLALHFLFVHTIYSAPNK